MPSHRSSAQTRASRLAAGLLTVVALMALMTLAACGGGSSGNNEAPIRSDAEAVRFLDQASFGATEADIAEVRRLGAGGWIDAQLAMPATSARAFWEGLDAANRATDPAAVSRNEVQFTFWRNAVTAPDQLRQRVAWALSQIFVVSAADSNVGEQPRGIMAYHDLLASAGLGSYRELLRQVSLSPVMGAYLSHLRNQKDDPATGRVPDENYAREVMQLFSIGLVELNTDGSVRRNGTAAIETYDAADVSGLARVFTGWSLPCGDQSNACYFGWSSAPAPDPDAWIKPMSPYGRFHATGPKAFLGSTVADQGSTPDAQASLNRALDTLASHPNVAPFIGRQLIQRLVTSNPSPAYVARISAVFNRTGGHLGAVVKAILLDEEARRAPDVADVEAGRLREPVLRLARLLRAFGARSVSGAWRIGNTDDPANSLGQSPWRSPSVFNFYRPGYVPPNSRAGALGLTVPEMQISHETSVAGYANHLRSVLQNNGVGDIPTGQTLRDVQLPLDNERGRAEQPDGLVGWVDARLFGGAMPAELRSEIVAAVASVNVPALTASNADTRNNALQNRLRLAIYLAMVSPEWLLQS
ncbi:DUF1800 domain-containing protein [Sphaerotilus mobilis]|uniref:Uncharacterized protein (DUF1800 family) n=1 Tax=Sphaerotilus mobilis TaxID=47994 RepID=A0A4Q7LW77_9BURK|nr:DUF1800 domain-containing protein [Sphaerotilus mobilis]RZS57969.1 uncharacterized protein (DUF1800 family) [Sphaerotilus mobilis]